MAAARITVSVMWADIHAATGTEWCGASQPSHSTHILSINLNSIQK